MSSLEFYGSNVFASCQYHAENFFIVLNDASGKYPMLERARTAFNNLNDDVFSFKSGDSKRLQEEVLELKKSLKLRDTDYQKNYAVFFYLLDELERVFEDSNNNETDIKFRWG